MAKQEILIVTCDKCGFEESDTTKFRHVTISAVTPGGRTTAPILSSRDLCESCLGLPGVNRDK